MATQAIYGKSSKLQRKNPSTGVFEDVPQCRIIPIPSATQQYVPSTNMDSLGGFEENEPTIKVGDELPFTFLYHYNIAMHGQINDDFINQTKLTWRVLFPGGAHGWDFEGYVSKFGGSLDYQSLLEVQASIKSTGLPVRF